MGRLKEFFLVNGVYRISDLLFHTHVAGWYSAIGGMLKWTPDRILQWQTAKMKDLIADAYQYSPYYRRLFDSLSLKPEDIRSFKDLEKIPEHVLEQFKVVKVNDVKEVLRIALC